MASAGCWQKASVSHHEDLSVGLLECLHDVVVDILQDSNLREKAALTSFMV